MHETSFDGGSFKKNLSSNKYHFFPLLNNFLPNAYELSHQPRILLDIFFLSIFFLRRISKDTRTIWKNFEPMMTR